MTGTELLISFGWLCLSIACICGAIYFAVAFYAAWRSAGNLVVVQVKSRFGKAFAERNAIAIAERRGWNSHSGRLGQKESR